MSQNATKALFSTNPRFVAGAAEPARIPKPYLPEIAFVGRSNVGKSSLLNALVGHSKLAHVSKTPGRTQQINFFNIGDKLQLVDLPGYGFAKVPPAMKAQWQALMDSYLRDRRTLRAVCLLADSRHAAKQSDIQALQWLASLGVPVLVVLTKADDTSQADMATHTAQWQAICANFPALTHSGIYPVSTKDENSIHRLRAALAELL